MRQCRKCGCPLVQLAKDNRRVLCAGCTEVPQEAPPVKAKPKGTRLLIEDASLVRAASRSHYARQTKWRWLKIDN